MGAGERLGDRRSTLLTYNNLSLIYGETRQFERAMHYALRFANAILGTPVPERLLAVGAPAPLAEELMDVLLTQLLFGQ